MLKDEFKDHALGCREVCPYCGSKCTEVGAHNKHQTNRHRIMGLRGSHKIKGNKIELLEICCSSAEAFAS